MIGDTQDKPPIELWQFRLSMYPEKARWALDYKGLPHVRHSLLPGKHVVPMLLRAGQKQLPVLRHGRALVKGSDSIIDYLEQHFPEPTLYPADPELKRRAIELQAWFDEIGVSIRRAFFQEFLPASQYAANLFSLGFPEGTRILYRAAFPVTRAIMKLDMKITTQGVEEGYRRTQEALDFVAENRGPQGYLVGEQFSVADLTAAVVLNSVVLPEEYPVAFPYPRPQGLERWLQCWADHPGASWVREMYSRHRGYSRATEDHNGWGNVLDWEKSPSALIETYMEALTEDGCLQRRKTFGKAYSQQRVLSEAKSPSEMVPECLGVVNPYSPC